MAGLFGKDRDLSAVPDCVEIVVNASDFQARREGFLMRLDRFLQWHLAWRSRNSIQRLIQEGYVAVAAAEPGGRTADEPVRETRPGRRFLHGSRVVVTIPEELRLDQAPATRSELRVLYDDSELLVVDKPAGQPVHPSGKHLTDTLIQRVHAWVGEHEPEATWRPKLCHRLDLETSGIVLLARNPQAHAELMRQFEDREVEKVYLAIVRGEPSEESGTIDFPIGSSRTSAVRLKMAALADGLTSRTEWRVLQRVAGRSLVACRPHTGRQHQIRVHMDAIGYPLVGDKLYGRDESVFLRAARAESTAEDRAALELERHALHNHYLAFRSPRSGERIALTCPLAEDLQRYLDDREARAHGRHGH